MAATAAVLALREKMEENEQKQTPRGDPFADRDTVLRTAIRHLRQHVFKAGRQSCRSAGKASG